ncbi:FtsX-like permease family protein [Paenibacillus sp. LMG 31459]|uniref:FtsX-like permease family protein n=1 Tax=Paenibacillus phytohabitans TaxID=2654978 RepID=A0ABX1YQU6_9BACL|nr:ABC transporter permease [Paenibacillus phytohabitans]NOU82193.1 FtsX-like permease family protein [Paenibacillus phytohabitans]
MFFRMLAKAFTVGFKGKLLLIITIAFGASLATAMLNVSLDVGDKMNRELKTYGANLQVLPKMDALPAEIDGVDFNPLADREFIDEQELPKIKTIFWAYNIVAFTPYLEASASVNNVNHPVAVVGTWFNKDLDLPTGEKINTGIRQLKTWWQVDGNWVKDDDVNTALVGSTLAGQLGITPGQTVDVNIEAGGVSKSLPLKVAGILSGGGTDDDKIFVSLSTLQQTTGLAGKVGRVEVSALTTPENELARRAALNPDRLSAKDYETWYCTAYVSAIAYQIEKALPGSEAKVIRQVAESEGMILTKIQLLMFILTAAALISSGLGISGLMTTKVLERSKEIGLMKALGAQSSAVLLLFVMEAVISGLAGGLLGYGAGLGFAQIIDRTVFDTALSFKGLVLPLVLLLSVLLTLAGSFSAMRMVIRLQPANVMRGGR